MTKLQRQILMIFTIIPLIGGFSIYLFLRKSNILLFDWIIFDEFKEFASHLKISSIVLPNWIGNFIPDGLWVFSFTSFIIYIWSNNLNYNTLFWIFIPLILAIAFEFGQKLKYFSGTYDIFDLMTYFIGNIFSLLLNYKFNKSLTFKFLQNDKN